MESEHSYIPCKNKQSNIQRVPRGEKPQEVRFKKTDKKRFKSVFGRNTKARKAVGLPNRRILQDSNSECEEESHDEFSGK